MANISKIEVGGTLYEIEDSVARRRTGGLTEDAKQALLACFQNVAWINDQGQTYYDALEDALYPPANLVSITAVYTQSGTVYDNQTLDSLKSDLVVTAFYDDESTSTTSSYTLSGTLTVGTSTITVAYGGKTATFTVTVTHATAQYTILNSLTNCTNSNSATLVNEETAYTGTLTADSGYIIAIVSITMSGNDITSTAYDSSDGSISIAEVTGNVVITAEAIEDVGWISGVPYEITWMTGTLDTTTGEYSENGSTTVSDFIPCKGVSAFVFGEGVYQQQSNIFFYDANKNFIVRTGRATNPVPSTQQTEYIRIRAATQSTATVTPYKYDVLDENTPWVAGTYYEMPFVSSTGTGATFGDAFIFGATTISLSDGTRRSHTFKDANKGTVASATDSASSYTVPEGAYYFTMGLNYGYSKLDRVWIKCE